MINLQKGQKISLTKENPGLNQIAVGLGWDENKGLFGMFGGDNIDCDASAFLLRNDKLVSEKDRIYYGHLEHSTHAVMHTGDNLTGEGDGDDETIYVDLDKVPQDVNKIVFTVNIYACSSRRQHFGMIKNAFIRVYDRTTGKELCKYNLSDDYKNKTALICGEIYRHDGEWKFNAIGEGTTDESISQLQNRFI